VGRAKMLGWMWAGMLVLMEGRETGKMDGRAMAADEDDEEEDMYPKGSVAPVGRDHGGGTLEEDELPVPFSPTQSTGVVAAVSPLDDLPVADAEADADPGDDVWPEELDDRPED
jgi:hypothetical protein